LPPDPGGIRSVLPQRAQAKATGPAGAAPVAGLGPAAAADARIGGAAARAWVRPGKAGGVAGGLDAVGVLGLGDLAGGDGLAAGISNTAPHVGHFPFLPAIAAGVRMARPHCEQGNSILSETSESAGAAGAGGAGDAEASGAAAAGMENTDPQWGHLPFFPAACSGVRNNC